MNIQSPISAAAAIQLDHGIELLNGQMFNFFNPGATEVSIEELAHVLSNICRFAGHVRYFYPVAQHLLNSSYLAPPGHERAALLHDTSEGFTNDIVTPLKFLVPTFKDIEIVIESDMGRRFDFQYPLSPEVKLVDLQMLKIEKEILKPSSSHWTILDGVNTDDVAISTLPYTVERFVRPFRRENTLLMGPMTPAQAKAAFLRRYKELTQ